MALAILIALPAIASPRGRRQRKSSHVEIVATVRAETGPRRVVHKNHRSFEELDVTILTFFRASEGSPGGDLSLAIDQARPVHLVHDLTCGGQWVEAQAGDRLELKGEYVHPPDGRDLIHFTHSAGAVETCGRSPHPAGYLKAARAPEVAPGQAAPPPHDLFAADVRPILVRRCAPCHEKGGKMYGRLPFDRPETLSSHAGGVRKRLKGEDLAAFEAWLASPGVGEPESPSR
jgi:hypothetical protein